jgi:two-component SAPR family response regulator
MLDILLIDDDELVRQSLHLLLTHEGFQVTCAASGREALEQAAQQSFDVVISDVRMPDLDGFGTVTQLRDFLPEANFVLITGYAEQDAPVQALRMGVDDFFRKPFDLSLFLERIRQIRRDRKQRRGRGEEQSLDSFIALLRRLPAYAERTDGAELAAMQAGRRLGLEDNELRALRAAVRFVDVVGNLPEASEVQNDEAHNLVERVAQLLALAKTRPLPSDRGAQLVAAVGELLAGRGLQGLGLDAAVQGEIGDRLGSETPSGSPLSPGQEPDLRVLSLGELRIFSKGQEVASSQWESSRARWLFLYLLRRRGQWVSADKLRDMFWPDSDADKAQRSLVSSVHRCRKALGDNDIILRSERGYTLNSERNIWWDVDQMHRLLRQAKPLEGAPEQCIPLLRQVENLYKGPYTEECPEEWAGFLRDDAKRCALSALELLGRLLLETDAVAAEGRARKILRFESTDEGAAAILLRALWAQGRRDEAIRFYRDFGVRLERELNLPPGPDMVRTYLELTQLT